MAGAAQELLRYLRQLSRPAAEPATDGVLLEQFLASRDEAAFEEIVARHGPLVWRVCRRLLANPSDAEDAFQAVFVILARKADRIRPQEALAGWLHGVARRVARRA